MGYLVPLEPQEGRRRFQVNSPLDGSEVVQFSVATAADVAAAVARGREAQKGWGATPVKERARLMQKVLTLLLERQDDIVARLRAETGRTELDTLLIEMFAAADTLNFYSRRAHKILADRKVGLHLLRLKSAKIVYQPLGVVGIISPWNGPFILSINPTIQAVLAGNAVVLKPSEVTPVAGMIISELFADAGFPEHLVQIVLGDGETGGGLIDGGIDKLCFTGSVRTGRKVGEACARNLIPCTLELGGKDPMIVCADANLDRAAGGALFGGLMNGGQVCMAVERIYVVEEVADEFTAKLLEKIAEVELGRDVGPFIFEPQAELVARHVDDAVAAGATVLFGGKREGNFFQPTVLADVTQDMDVMKEETFGPVLPIRRVADEDEAIRLANDSRFGLTATVWTRDKAKGERIARQLHAGSVTINETSLVYGALEVGFGGRGDSGVGQVNGAEGLRAYTHAMPIVTDRFGLATEQQWYPHTEDKVDGFRKALKTIWGSPLRWFM